MFSGRGFSRVEVNLQQVRYKRRLAVPKYRPQYLPQKTHPKKDHSSTFNRAIKGWLGPKNIRGEYYRNAYYYPSQNHTPNYIVSDGQTVVDSTYMPTRSSNLQPFPLNKYCKTNYIISNELKAKIIYDNSQKGLHIQEIANKYGIKMERIEAIIRLNKIESDWIDNNLISKDLQKFSDIMYKMFPLFQEKVTADNLTEIPTPHKTLHQRFLTIAESEPFGPVDAANLLKLPVAKDTLSKLSEIVEDSTSTSAVKTNEVVVGKEKQGDRTVFKFTSATSGDVGFRYGASRRDTKKNRSIGFDAQGKLCYI